MGDFEAKRYWLAVELLPAKWNNGSRSKPFGFNWKSITPETHAARLGLSRLMRELDDVDDVICIQVLSWLAEAVGRWEWYGLQERMFDVILTRLSTMKAEQAVNKVQLSGLLIAQAEMLDRSERLVERFIQKHVPMNQGNRRTAFSLRVN